MGTKKTSIWSDGISKIAEAAPQKAFDQPVDNCIKLNTYFRLSRTLGLGANLKFDNMSNYNV
jgi:hypothetical protein